MENDFDMQLYNSYLNGDNDAFEQLYKKYKDKVLYFIFNIVKDYQKAEDITQDVFLYIFQNRKRDNGSFKYYIYLVAKSRALSYLNIEKNRLKINEKYLSNESEQIESDVLDIITKEESKTELMEAINMLDSKYKNVIYLIKIEELSYKETAEILGESIQNLKIIVHRGKKQLQKILIKKDFYEMNKVTKIVLLVICTTICLSGVVFSGVLIYKNYIKLFGPNSSDGVDIAVNNGYFVDVNTEYQNKEGIEISVASMLIDDFNFDMNFNVILSEKYDFDEIDFVDLKIVDETGKIVFNTPIPEFETEEMREKIYRGGYSLLSTKVIDNKFNVSLSATGNSEPFPKSRHLTVTFSKIRLRKYINSDIIEDLHNGDWIFEIDVPEEFYNRDSISYKAKSSNDKGIDLNEVEATIYNTAFKLYIPTIESKKIDFNYFESEKFGKEDFYKMNAIDNEYAQNSRGERFETSQRSDGDSGFWRLEGQRKIIDYHQTFNLTKYDATDEITVHMFTNKKKEIIIKFERIY